MNASAVAAPEGAVSQSIRIAFRALHLAMVALVALWAAGNVRRVPPDQQALVLRFGRPVRVQGAGLVYTWPRPFEDVVLLPGPTSPQGLAIDLSHRAIRALAVSYAVPRANRIPASAGVFLTGNGAVVVLQAYMTWRVVDPGAFYLSRDRIEPALERLFGAAATEVAAAHELDDFLAVRPERANDPAAQSRRQAIRGELADAVNARLRALPEGGRSGLGVEVTRIDLTPMLPPDAREAFDAVLLGTQEAEQRVATARTQAVAATQAAEQARDARLLQARAVAVERVSAARERTAAIVVLHDRPWRRVGRACWSRSIGSGSRRCSASPAGSPRWTLPAATR